LYGLGLMLALRTALDHTKIKRRSRTAYVELERKRRFSARVRNS